MTGGYDLERKPQAALHGAAHITGGGLPEKLFRRLLKPRGLGAAIDILFEPSELIHYCQKMAISATKKLTKPGIWGRAWC